ncbi:MAG: hypothetical protein JSS32_01420 [Verrucomicrobia bacterium]|nr:hypothetical protein [Verrucomicrobiota bacterium]
MEFKALLNHLLERSQVSAPLGNQIQISVDLTRKQITFSLPIFKSFGELPQTVAEYVEKRKRLVFKPHATSFKQELNQIHLVQEISFPGEFQNALRQNLHQFKELAKHCHQMLKEIAAEEKCERILPIDSDLDE